jgi:SWI/SNF-related matrix-associated actin-dependent regulator of chromatin subfamily A3
MGDLWKWIDPDIDFGPIPFPCPISLNFETDYKTLITNNGDGNGTRLGTVSQRTSKIIQTLQSTPDIAMRCFAKNVSSSNCNDDALSRKSCCKGTWQLCINIYGPTRQFEPLGDFMDACGIYLQDPERCDRNVAYRNPHRLSRIDGIILYTQSLPNIEAVVEVEDNIANPLDLLEAVEENEALPLSPPPSALRTALFK